MKSTRFIGIVGVSFLLTRAVIVGQRWTPDLLPLTLVGIVVGIVASVPVSLAMIAIVRRRAQ